MLAYETMTPNYDRGLRLLADVMDIAESGVQDAFVAAGSERQRTQVAPEADAFIFATIASTEGVYNEASDMQHSVHSDRRLHDDQRDRRRASYALRNIHRGGHPRAAFPRELGH